MYFLNIWHFQLYTIYLAVSIGHGLFRQIDSRGFQYFEYVSVSHWKKINLVLLTERANKCICIISFQFATFMERDSSVGKVFLHSDVFWLRGVFWIAQQLAVDLEVAQYIFVKEEHFCN